MRQIIAILAFTFSATASLAQTGIADLRLLPGWRMEGGRHMAALEVRLDPGWKTYWRRPGEAGIPPAFNWSGSDNVADVQVHWPTPKVFWQSGMRSVGYSDVMVLPIEVTPTRPGQPITLHMGLDMGVCQDICVPVNATAKANLSPTPARPDARISHALADRPLTEQEAGVAGTECDIRLTPDGATLTAHLRMPPIGPSEEIVFEPADPGLYVGEPQTTRMADTLSATVALFPQRGQPLVLDRNNLRMTVIGADNAVEIIGCD